MKASRLAHWHDVAVRQTASASAASLIENPDYDLALRKSIYGALDFYDSDPALGVVFQDIGTFGLGALALYLDATGGITHRRLAELGSTATFLSSGRASAVLGLLRIKRLAHREGGGRHVRYLPSERLICFFRARFRVEVSALAIIEPEILPLLERWDEPSVFSRFWAFCGAEMMRAAKEPIEDVKSVEAISFHRAGFLILFDLLRRADKGAEFPSMEPFEIVVSETARRFSVSRAHVRRMMDKFEQDGLMTRDESTGMGQFLPAFYTTLRRYIALLHIGILASAYDALRPFE